MTNPAQPSLPKDCTCEDGPYSDLYCPVHNEESAQPELPKDDTPVIQHATFIPPELPNSEEELGRIFAQLYLDAQSYTSAEDVTFNKAISSAKAAINKWNESKVLEGQIHWINQYLLAWSGELPFEALDSMTSQLAELTSKRGKYE